MRLRTLPPSRTRAVTLALAVAAATMAAAPAAVAEPTSAGAAGASSSAAPNAQGLRLQYLASSYSLVTGTEFRSEPPTITSEGALQVPLTWSAPGLPSGLSIVRATGAIIGTPMQPGTYSTVVTVTDKSGASARSQQLSFTVAEAPDSLVPLSPKRIMDTRDNGSTVDGAALAEGPLTIEGSRVLKVTGRAGVPASGVDAVVLNVTVTRPTVGGHLTIWPAGQDRPTASNLNYLAGQTVPNLVVAKVGEDGYVEIANAAGEVDVIVDVAGWLPSGGDFTALQPGRLMDTRATGETVDGVGEATGALGANTTRSLDIVGRHGIPTAGVDSVVLNVTAVRPSTASHLTVWPTGQAKPTASNLNYAAGVVRPNLVVVKLGADGGINLANAAGRVDVIVDVAGWFSSTGGFTAITPARLQDTRPGGATIDGQASGTGVVRAGAPRTLKVAGRNGIPADARAVVLNVTAVRPSTASHLTVWPTGEGMPTASNLNFTAGTTVPNLVIAKVGANGSINISNAAGGVDVVVDVSGYWGPLG